MLKFKRFFPVWISSLNYFIFEAKLEIALQLGRSSQPRLQYAHHKVDTLDLKKPQNIILVPIVVFS